MATPREQSETRVLAIASHVTYGYVGNKMATFVMQALGCDVSAIDTVHFSNHTAYKQFRGRRVAADEIQSLYDGLKQSDLHHFDMMLSGYTATKDALEVVGSIGREQRLLANMKPGSFFWILDPVMGDHGRLYVAEEIVPVYKSLLHHADLIVPNCFEAELLSESKINDLGSLANAVAKLHRIYQVPHIVVTSLRIDMHTGDKASTNGTDTLAVVGSTCRKDLSPRLFSITVPSIDVFFSGTGDMFAAMMLVRLREAASAANPPLLGTSAWQSPDNVSPLDLPLAKATEKVLASMQTILLKTMKIREQELENLGEIDEKTAHLVKTRASEVKVVRFVDELRYPELQSSHEKFRAELLQSQSMNSED